MDTNDTQAHTLRSTLTADDRVALVRWLVERRGLGEKQLARLWRMGVVMNAVMGVLVGAWFVLLRWNGNLAQAAVVFVLAMTVFWALSGTALWLLRRLRGGHEGDVARAIERARAKIEAEHNPALDHAYTLAIEHTGVRETYRGQTRHIPWTDIDGAEVWTLDRETFAAVRTSDGLGVIARDEHNADAAAFVRHVEQRSRDA